MKKKKWWILLFLVIVFLVIAIGIGGKVQMEQKELDTHMLEVVKSDEAKKVFEEGLKNLDPNALTPEGIIKTYKIDYDNIEKNPMGGINVTLFVNDDSSLYVRKTLKNYDGNKIEGGGGGYSSELEKILGEDAHGQ